MDLATITKNYTAASTSYTIPAGDHILSGGIRLQSGKKLTLARNCRLFMPDGVDDPILYGERVKNFIVDLGDNSIYNQTTSKTDSTAYRNGIQLEACSKGTIMHGEVHGGVNPMYIYNCTDMRYINVRAYDSILGFGWLFAKCRNVMKDCCGAYGNFADGCRFLADNIGGDLYGCEYSNNGSAFMPGQGQIIGVGLHMGQSSNFRVRKCRTIGNVGIGFEWKSSVSPDTDVWFAPAGTPENLEVIGLVSHSNGSNQFDIRWNKDTRGTVRPRGLKFVDCSIGDGHPQTNAIYLNADDISGSGSIIYNTDYGILQIKLPGDADVQLKPAWDNVKTLFYSYTYPSSTKTKVSAKGIKALTSVADAIDQAFVKQLYQLHTAA